MLNGERVRHWIARGAQPSNTVKRLMKTQGLSATGVTKARLSPEAPVESEGAEATSSDTAPPRSPEAGAASPESGTPGGEAGSPSSGAEAGQPPEGPDPGADPPTLPDGELLAPDSDVEQADAGAAASNEGDASAH